LTRQSEGNPFFVAEYLRAAVEEGLLWRDQGGRWQVAERWGSGDQRAEPAPLVSQAPNPRAGGAVQPPPDTGAPPRSRQTEVEGGAVQQAPEAGASYERLPLPGSLRDLVGRRLSDLPAEARAVLSAAAVLGREPVLALLERVAGLSED